LARVFLATAQKVTQLRGLAAGRGFDGADDRIDLILNHDQIAFVPVTAPLKRIAYKTLTNRPARFTAVPSHLVDTPAKSG
jgi:hypothetical protein